MRKIVLVMIVVFSLSFVVAQNYSIDIVTDKQSYSSGEIINFNIRLIEGNISISEDVSVCLFDLFERKIINISVKSNEDNFLLIEDVFPCGQWIIKSEYKNKTKDVTFLIEENTDVEFIVKKDKLIIKNKGNVPYTKNVQVIIGNNKPQNLMQNIKVGGKKELKLVAPEGTYDIKITDGERTAVKKNVELFGTGNVVGAISEEVLGTGLLGGPIDPDKMDNKVFSRDKFPVSALFISAVCVLLVLVLIKRKVEKNVKSNK